MTTLTRTAVLSLLAALGCDAPLAMTAGPAPTVETLAVTRGNVAERMLLTGELDAEDSVELLVPRTDNWSIGIQWMIDDGARVKAGDKIVEFDNTAVVEKLLELELTAIEKSIELDGEKAKTAVEVADKKFEVENQRTQVEKAELDATVPEELLSRREHQDFRLALARAKVEQTRAKEDLRSIRDGGRFEQQVKQIEFDKALRAYRAAEEQLDALTLKAPRDGVVVVGMHWEEPRKLQVGDNIWSGMTAAKLPDLSQMIVEAQLSDVDDGRVLPGMKATCIVDAYPDTPLQGVVRGVNPVADTPDRQSTRRFFGVAIALEEVDTSKLRPGLSVKVEIVTRQAEDVVVVPRAAVDPTGDQPTATLADGSEVPVEIDFCDAMGCAVSSGLSEGDRVRPRGKVAG